MTGVRHLPRATRAIRAEPTRVGPQRDLMCSPSTCRLRERREDIPRLVRHFVSKYAIRFEKAIETIPSSAMQALSDWDRPGNVRELENVIERSVILSRGPRLAVPLSELEERPEGLEDNLEAAEREHILKVLRECGEGLSGEKGAKKSKSGLRSLLSS